MQVNPLCWKCAVPQGVEFVTVFVNADLTREYRRAGREDIAVCSVKIEGEPRKRYRLNYWGHFLGSYDTATEAVKRYDEHNALIRPSPTRSEWAGTRSAMAGTRKSPSAI